MDKRRGSGRDGTIKWPDAWRCLKLFLLCLEAPENIVNVLLILEPDKVILCSWRSCSSRNRATACGAPKRTLFKRSLSVQGVTDWIETLA